MAFQLWDRLDGMKWLSYAVHKENKECMLSLRWIKCISLHLALDKNQEKNTKNKREKVETNQAEEVLSAALNIFKKGLGKKKNNNVFLFL